MSHIMSTTNMQRELVLKLVAACNKIEETLSQNKTKQNKTYTAGPDRHRARDAGKPNWTGQQEC